ncbi:MAG: SirB2 family protein [Gammaproteobacteria bacterium]|nr:SirB2 family protein [Gammaproteobacteria bacterium]
MTLNICIFMIRFYWMMQKSGWVHKKPVRYISVFNDTILLIAGASMAIMSHQYPFVAPWLTTKLVMLLVYIVFGSLALKRGSSMRIRIYCGVIAMCCFLYMVSVAFSRTPASWGFFGL